MDVNHDQAVTKSELFNYLDQKVLKYSFRNIFLLIQIL